MALYAVLLYTACLAAGCYDAAYCGYPHTGVKSHIVLRKHLLYSPERDAWVKIKYKKV